MKDAYPEYTTVRDAAVRRITARGQAAADRGDVDVAAKLLSIAKRLHADEIGLQHATNVANLAEMDGS